MDGETFLRTRRSIRLFKPEPVPDQIIQRILTTAIHAPSAHNRQPWRFAVLTDLEIKSRLAEDMTAVFRRDLERDNLPKAEVESRLMKSSTRVRSCPLVIILCMEMSEMDKYPDQLRNEAERVMTIQSTANAGLQLLLAAHAEELGGVWTCGPLFAPDVVAAALSLPKTWEPQAMVLIGYPADQPNKKNIKPLSEVMWIPES